ncbi:hypothetical protein VNO80_19534 [Phaseolus coccineus]|uniref:Uncharacterized protein n=1 Tax=Phaseolus coccineus TaxID=3886 RepID=A0AAN9QZV4_PHACN
MYTTTHPALTTTDLAAPLHQLPPQPRRQFLRQPPPSHAPVLHPPPKPTNSTEDHRSATATSHSSATHSGTKPHHNSGATAPRPRSAPFIADNHHNLRHRFHAAKRRLQLPPPCYFTTPKNSLAPPASKPPPTSTCRRAAISLTSNHRQRGPAGGWVSIFPSFACFM